MSPRLADLVRRARRLAAERDRLIDGLAAEWAKALGGRGLSASDLDEFWAGLTEDAVRRAGREAGRPRREAGQQWSAQAWRAETQEVLARVRVKVEAVLGER